MARLMPKVDAVMVCGGWTGILMGKELAAAGLRVAVLERGAKRATVPDFQSGHMHDELDVSVRFYATMQDTSRDTYSFRNTPEQVARPIRRLGSALPGTGLGGAGVHWSGAYYRYDEEEFAIRSNYTRKYGARIFDEELQAQDWLLSCLAAGLCGPGAALRPLRAPVRHLRPRRQHRGAEVARRQPVRGAPEPRLPQPAHEGRARQRHLQQGGI